jgi:fatty-acyl-CoA synthase
VPIAYVIRRKGGTVDAEGLKVHIQLQLARFKVPREIVFVEDLPRTALGKVQHFMLKQIDASRPVRGDVA